MRTIITQVSILVAILTALNLNGGDFSFLTSSMWGIASGLLVCLVLLLGDFSIHRLLDNKSGLLTSARFRGDIEVTDWMEELYPETNPTSHAVAEQLEKEAIAA